MEALDIVIGFVIGGTAGTLWTYAFMTFSRPKNEEPELNDGVLRYQEFKAKKLNKS